MADRLDSQSSPSHISPMPIVTNRKRPRCQPRKTVQSAVVIQTIVVAPKGKQRQREPVPLADDAEADARVREFFATMIRPRD